VIILLDRSDEPRLVCQLRNGHEIEHASTGIRLMVGDDVVWGAGVALIARIDDSGQTAQGAGLSVCYGIAAPRTIAMPNVEVFSRDFIALNGPIAPVSTLTLRPTVERHFNTSKSGRFTRSEAEACKAVKKRVFTFVRVRFHMLIVLSLWVGLGIKLSQAREATKGRRPVPNRPALPNRLRLSRIPSPHSTLQDLVAKAGQIR